MRASPWRRQDWNSCSSWTPSWSGASERRWRTRGDDLAGLAAGVAEPVRDRAREIVGVARPELSCFGPDGQLDAAADDDAALLALVPQHVGPGIRARRIALV